MSSSYGWLTFLIIILIRGDRIQLHLVLLLKYLRKFNTENAQTKHVSLNVCQKKLLWSIHKRTFLLESSHTFMVCQPFVTSSLENTALNQSHSALNFYSKHPPYRVCSLHQNADESSAFQHRMLQLSFPSLAMLMDGASEPHLVGSYCYTEVSHRPMVFKWKTPNISTKQNKLKYPVLLSWICRCSFISFLSSSSP